MPNNYISDAELDSYYAGIFEDAYGYDPLVGPYDEDEEENEED